MPNWVYNRLQVEGSEADVAALKAQVGKPYMQKGTAWEGGTMVTKEVPCEDEFSFWNIISPAGADLVKYEDSIGASGVSPFWYSWNSKFWGTKWDAGDVSLSEVSETVLIYAFSTPWGVPNPALSTLAEQYPDVVLTNHWEEEQGFGGTIQYSGSDIEVLDEYDIPDTHAELIERKGECWRCSDGDYEPWEFFSDCPGYMPEDTAQKFLIPHDELEVAVSKDYATP